MLTNIILPNGKLVSPDKLVQKGVGFLPKTILSLIVNELQEENPFRASSISGCLLKAYLRFKYPYSLPLKSLYIASFRGSFIHALLKEEAEIEKSYLAEKRYFATVSGIEISGQIDLYDPKRKRIVDYKTTANINPYYSPYDNHIRQLEIYRFLLEANGLEVRSCSFVYLSMQEWCRVLMSDKTTTAMYPKDNGWSKISLEKYLRNREDVGKWLTERVLTLNEAITNNVTPAPEPSALCDLSNKKRISYCEMRSLCSLWNPEEETDSVHMNKEVSKSG